MSTTIADLVVDVTTNAIDAVAGMGDVGGAAESMADRVDRAGAAAESTGRKLSVSADSADEFAGKTGKATGALGALSSGFELVGLGGFASGLQSASMATDFLSGAGDSLTLVMESQAVATVRAKVAAAGSAIATRAAGAAARVAAAGQWLLNAALTANPIGLVVIALVALAAGVVLAYRKSDRFREVVDRAFRVVTFGIRLTLKVVGAIAPKFLDAMTMAAHWVSSKVSSIVSFFGRLPGRVGGAVRALPGVLRDAVVDTFHVATDKAGQGVGWVVDAVAKLPGKIVAKVGAIKRAGGDLIRGFIDGLSQAPDFVSNIAGKIWDAIRGMLNAAIHAINNALSIDIDWPGPGSFHWHASIPDIPGGSSRVAAPIAPTSRALLVPSPAGADWTAGGTSSMRPVQIIVQGAVDVASTARQIQTILSTAGRSVGVRL